MVAENSIGERYIDDKNSVYVVNSGRHGVMKVADKKARIEDVLYMSEEIFNDLYRDDYKKSLDKDHCCDMMLKNEFISDVSKESQHSGLAGILVYFIKRGEKYEMRHSQRIKKIDKVKIPPGYIT